MERARSPGKRKAPGGSAVEDCVSELEKDCEEAIWVEGRPASYGDGGEVGEVVCAVIENMGIERMYTHQEEALKEARSGKNVCLCTGTSERRPHLPSCDLKLDSAEVS